MTIIAPEDGDLVDPVWAEQVTDAVNQLNLHTSLMGCTLRRAANQTLNDVTLTPVSFDTETEDTDGFWAAGSPTLITIPETGLYGIAASALLASAPTGRSFIEIVPSAGVFTTDPKPRAAGTPTEPTLYVAASLLFTATNTFVVNVFADVAANTTMTVTLSCYRLAGGA